MGAATSGLLVSDSAELTERARRLGVATEYADQRNRTITVPPAAVRKVTDLLGDAAVAPARQAAESIRLPVGRRAWGWMVQLYALPSRESWGVGDLRDLRTLVEWTAGHGGGLVLVNPLHAVAPGTPMQTSPYFPSSRRFTNPLYLRIEDVDEYRAASPALRADVDALRVRFEGDRIDRDTAWTAKHRALQMLAPPDFPVAEDARDFATWCALAEVHGNDWRSWPEALRRPRSDDVAAAATPLADRVSFHAWLQVRCADQLAAVQEAARAAGMSVGVVHDLAVGTDPGGADAWELQDTLVLGAHLGAPPDPFNQQGQDWGMPPWHPSRLAHQDYAPLRELAAGLLRHAGGVRIDHVLGMFRSWWVPEGDRPSEGTYVRYDADAMLDAVTGEAARVGAVVVGEDLGTTPKSVHDKLAEHGVLGTSVLWFERDEAARGEPGPLRPPRRWREAAMASITTHDLPTALGWLRGEHVRVRRELGLLDDPDAEERWWRRERAELLGLLRDEGLLRTAAGGAEVVAGEPEVDVDEAEVVRAMHRAVASTPSRYVVASLGDAVGDLRQPNLPGTTQEYPNWQLPVADSQGRVMRLDELLADRRVVELAGDLTDRIGTRIR